MGTVVRIAKASKSDIQSTEMLLDLLEKIFYGEGIEHNPIFKKLVDELGYIHPLSTEELEVVKLGIIKRYFNNCSGRWVKVINTVEIMVDQICSKDTMFIELNPYLKRASNNSILGE